MKYSTHILSILESKRGKFVHRSALIDQLCKELPDFRIIKMPQQERTVRATIVYLIARGHIIIETDSGYCLNPTRKADIIDSMKRTTNRAVASLKRVADLQKSLRIEGAGKIFTETETFYKIRK